MCESAPRNLDGLLELLAPDLAQQLLVQRRVLALRAVDLPGENRQRALTAGMSLPCAPTLRNLQLQRRWDLI